MSTTTTTTALTAADLDLTVARKATTPAAVPALIAGLRDAVTEWDRLANSEREDGGKIRADWRQGDPLRQHVAQGPRRERRGAPRHDR